MATKDWRYSDGNTYTGGLTLAQARKFRRQQNGGTIARERRIDLEVSEREFDTIVAALRMWQVPGAHIVDGDGELANIVEEHDDALTDAEVDTLIERMN